MKRYRSEDRAHQDGAQLNYPNWIPDRGPTGRLLVCAGLEICANLVGDVATAVIQGEDLWKYFQSVVIRGRDGRVIWQANGEASRLESILRLGPTRYVEHADVATVTDGAITVRCFIPFRIFSALEPQDFEVPAFALESVELQVASDSTLDIGSSAVTLDSGTVYVNAWCREVDAIPLGASWAFRTLQWQATAETTIPLNGAVLYSAFAYASGASGGVTLANFDSHTIDGLIDQPWDERDARNYMTWARGESRFSGGTVGDPVYGSPFSAATPFARILFALPDGGKIKDAPHVPGNLIVRATNTVTNLITGYTVIRPRNAELSALVARKFGVPKSAFRVHTKRGSRRRPSAWANKGSFMPARAPDPRRAEEKQSSD